MSSQNHELVQNILALDFFKEGSGRGIKNTEETIQVNNYMFHVLYDDEESEEVINSVMVLRGGYREPGEGKRPGYSMVTTRNAIAKYDVDEGKIVVSIAAIGNHPGCTVEFPGNCEEDAFFQESLVTDLGGITYDFIRFAREVVDMAEEMENAGSL